MKQKAIITILICAILAGAATYYMLHLRGQVRENRIRKLKAEKRALTEELAWYKIALKADLLYASGDTDEADSLYREILDAGDTLLAKAIKIRVNMHKTLLNRSTRSTRMEPEIVPELSPEVITPPIDQNEPEIVPDNTNTEPAESNPANNSKIMTLTLKSTKGTLFEYHGQVVNDMAEGYGTADFQTGSSYQGQWHNNMRHGKGVFTWQDGEWYEGEFANDMREGYGVYHWANGERYEGQWEKDMRNGKGKVYKKNGRIKLQGKWRNDTLVE